MKTFPIENSEGAVVAFEMYNLFLPKKRIISILTGCKNISNIEKAKMFDENDARIYFSYKEKRYAVIEPYGDNSRYWVGDPEKGIDTDVDISLLKDAFKKHKRFYWL